MAVDVFVSEEKIQKRVVELAEQINRDYAGKELMIVGILNGAFMFCADLIRHIKVPVQLEFMSASSYGDGTESSGNVKINMDVKKEMTGKHVLLIEDIVDTGLTLSSLMHLLEKRNPASLKLCSLLYKPARIKHQVKIDYLAFEIEDHFVIGYGLDYAGAYRELPYIGIYKND
ncbi:MAG: hypoxanthine phosphoribosyltransferase [Bdellovibrio sp. CG12_big_fil_rev_8_21_14_0_65_39_13]|nr:MAG: hypoxanthine phosphoribosyltransferase [Bdellovibrio sp. CG22_combo_CG10-13_8_21_14_all_39_27]PIQ58963.1 MAG: hypoxanthine phosphoribosyltransferase [Bdellovibrio sp. CG12_big_fil_rev_8_21_14_0_65_39_13]PIR33931.1 MAG: hypoxanthine phosphoribosyltransferase [Bdellovibrio sp. CG11_big_fil_rev_8_21_14_0_20_39_38]PJB52274.1 MAG: hypoxanthine phosphoribosyltransferase [Bdellovibrio sp. CG_4_9_14_3_um_filter_39_7]